MLRIVLVRKKKPIGEAFYYDLTAIRAHNKHGGCFIEMLLKERRDTIQLSRGWGYKEFGRACRPRDLEGFKGAFIQHCYARELKGNWQALLPLIDQMIADPDLYLTCSEWLEPS